MLGAAASAVGAVLILIYVAFIVFMTAAGWKVFTKAGRPGWGVLIPIYNIYLWCKIAGRPGWWTLLYFIPVVNIVISLIVTLYVAAAFSKSAAFGVGLWILGVVLLPILGYGSATYSGNATFTVR